MLLLVKIAKWFVKLLLWFLIASVLSVLLFKYMPVPVTPLMILRCIEQKGEDKDMRLKHDWVALEDISERLQLAVVCSEDQNYLKHSGFDWGAIKKVMKENEKGKRIRGGSTITQQTAKNVFLWPGRSYVRKGFEVYFTFLIELFWSKERIMEVYLNSIEMGDGIYGAEAASLHWFNKSAKKLSKDEAAAIAAILPNPRKYVANPPGRYVKTRIAWVKQQMSFWGNDLDYEKEEENESK